MHVPQKQSEATGPDRTGRRGQAVLILEPDPSQQSRLARMITVGGHRVVGTSSLDGALALLSQFPVDLLLISEECARAWVDRLVAYAQDRRPGVRVIILAADADPSRLRRTYPGVRYVQRPARMEHLSALTG